MVVQTRFFSCRFSISHAKRPTTAPRRAARVRATAFPARPWSDACFAETQNASAAAASGPYRIDIVDRKPGSARGQKGTVVEARDRCGGRNYPLPDQAFGCPPGAKASERTRPISEDRAVPSSKVG